MAAAYARERHEQVAGLQVRVSIETWSPEAPAAMPPVAERSPRGSRAAQPRASSRPGGFATSSNGWVTPAMIWFLLVPLPATTNTSPPAAWRRRRGSPAAAPISWRFARPPEPRRGSRSGFARIVAGDDGDVEVDGDPPISGRLAAAGAAGAEDDDQACARGPQRLEHGLQPSGVWA
jgi:hypothetical protein